MIRSFVPPGVQILYNVELSITNITYKLLIYNYLVVVAYNLLKTKKEQR